MAPVVETVTSVRVGLGEGPHWSVETQSLYYVDITGQAIYRYVPATNKLTKAVVDGVVSIIIPVEGQKNKYVITQDRKIVVVTWDGESPKVSKTEVLAEVEKDKLENAFNDGKADPSGRLWVGTRGPFPVDEEENQHRGALYSLLPGNKVKNHLSDVSVSNGLAWNSKHTKFYYVDSIEKTVDEFDFDLKKGEITNRKPIFDLVKNNIPGFPDGITIDSEDKLWVAVFDGSRVIRIDPVTSKVLATVNLPTPQITSVAWGGPNLDALYVTSNSTVVQADAAPSPAPAGAVFRVTGLGVRGLPAVNVKLQ